MSFFIKRLSDKSLALSPYRISKTQIEIAGDM